MGALGAPHKSRATSLWTQFMQRTGHIPRHGGPPCDLDAPGEEVYYAPEVTGFGGAPRHTRHIRRSAVGVLRHANKD